MINRPALGLLIRAKKLIKSAKAAAKAKGGRPLKLLPSWKEFPGPHPSAGYRRAPVSTKSMPRLPHCEHFSRLTQSITGSWI